MTGAALVPLRPSFRPRLVLNTWDRTVVPWPWARFQMEVGPIQVVAPDAGEDELGRRQEQLAEFFL
jgi:lysophospholipid acyltransferase (LPLAT)-like uncharacterized protein